MTVVHNGPSLSQAGLSRVLPTIISHRYGQRGAEPHQQKGVGMKKELLTVKELAAGTPHDFEVDPAGLSQGGDPRAVVSWLACCCTWIHLLTAGYI